MTLSTFTILVPLLELTFSEAKIQHNWTVSEDKSLSPELACMCEEGHTLIKTLAKGRPWFQHFALLLLVWHSALWTVQEATPLGPASSLPPSFLLQCLEQVRKIRADGAVLQERLCATYKLCHPEELVLLGHSLGITQAPLSSCSSQALEVVSVCLEGRKEGEPTPPVPGLSRSPGSKLGARLPASQPPPNPHIVSLQVDCLHQLHSGLVLYQGLLQALAGTSPEVASTLDLLHLDVADFAINIWQQMEDMGVAPTGKPTQGPMPTFTSAFQRRAGGVLVASNLQSFLEQAYRVLRYLAQP
nr:granulocyte colony-stimulating factor isoform X4 [Loxodonta africana]